MNYILTGMIALQNCFLSFLLKNMILLTSLHRLKHKNRFSTMTSPVFCNGKQLTCYISILLAVLQVI